MKYGRRSIACLCGTREGQSSSETVLMTPLTSAWCSQLRPGPFESLRLAWNNQDLSPSLLSSSRTPTPLVCPTRIGMSRPFHVSLADAVSWSKPYLSVERHTPRFAFRFSNEGVNRTDRTLCDQCVPSLAPVTIKAQSRESNSRDRQMRTCIVSAALVRPRMTWP